MQKICDKFEMIGWWSLRLFFSVMFAYSSMSHGKRDNMTNLFLFFFFALN